MRIYSSVNILFLVLEVVLDIAINLLVDLDHFMIAQHLF